MPVIVRRGEVWAVLAGDARIRDAGHARPFVILSPPELADPLPTIIAAPLTTGARAAPFRIAFRYKGASAVVVLDQLRTLEKSRLLHRAGMLSPATLKATLQALSRLFAA